MNDKDVIWQGWREADDVPYMDEYFFGEGEILDYPQDMLFKLNKQRGLLDLDYVASKERKTVFWLAEEIRFPVMTLLNLLGSIRRRRVHYCVHLKEKKNGEFRIIQEPSPALKVVQKGIKNNLLFGIPTAPNVYGFSSGSVLDAIRPHLNSRVRMMVDIKDAFPSILYHSVFNFLKYDNQEKKWAKYWPKPHDGGHFSWYASRIICDLCTHEQRLPQGAPTSPRLFDLVFGQIDRELNSLAKSYKAVYTRYADNIFFSTRQEILPNKLKWGVVKAIEGPNRNNLHLAWHKMKIRPVGEEANRMLGLNLIGQKIHNTRKFKRRLRLLVHHIGWLRDHGRYIFDEYEQLTGLLGFAAKETLPKGLANKATGIKLSGQYQLKFSFPKNTHGEMPKT